MREKRTPGNGGISRVPAKNPWRLRASFQGNAAKNIRFYAMYVTQGR